MTAPCDRDPLVTPCTPCTPCTMLLLVVVMVASVARAETEELGAGEWSHLDQATLLLSTPGDTAGQQWLALYISD